MAATRRIIININGVSTSHEVEPRLLLVHYIRDMVGLTGTHVGCETNVCGVCAGAKMPPAVEGDNDSGIL